MKILTLLSIAFVLIFNACSGSDSEKSISLKTGKYGYVLSDSSGNSLVEGEMSVVTITKQQGTGDENDYEMTGSYTVTKNTADTSYQGFSTMNGGEMKGYYSDKKKFININTNPKIADANVFINAFVKSKSMDGGWHFSTFRGTDKEGGIFKATKLK